MISTIVGLLISVVMLFLTIIQPDTQLINIVIWVLFMLYNLYEMYFFQKNKKKQLSASAYVLSKSVLVLLSSIAVLIVFVVKVGSELGIYIIVPIAMSVYIISLAKTVLKDYRYYKTQK